MSFILRKCTPQENCINLWDRAVTVAAFVTNVGLVRSQALLIAISTV